MRKLIKVGRTKVSGRYMKYILPGTLIAATVSGCAVYSDHGRGVVAIAWDSAAIKAQLQQAEREYGGH
jgi:hypothetical protein